MTLTEILQIRERFLRFEDMRALDYAERRWKEEGSPTERWQLINFLEEMLIELTAIGIGYPKILLLRKKEIQRRTFVLPSNEDASAAPGPQNTGGDDVCPDCRGRMYVLLPDGTPTLCLPCLGRGRRRKSLHVTVEPCA